MQNANLISINIDGKPISTGLGYTIIQVCSQILTEVPRFCYHDKLLIAGNCRICLVELKGSKKLVASCAVHVAPNMSVYTNTIRVRLARQNVLEFLLSNHPLDCPICDQGGECDLQDITAIFGADRGRFYEIEKRAVLNKDFGPLIRTSMNRCIHCTRCVRFITLSSGFSVLGTLGRGSVTEIGAYVTQFIGDELSGNIVDLCPVGALTSKPYSFRARPWELTSVVGVDVFDVLNSTLLFEIAANQILRVLPYLNENINECWLTNRARYTYDGLFVQRLTSCLLRCFISHYVVQSEIWWFSCGFIKLPWTSAVSLFFCELYLNVKNKAQRLVTAVGGILDFGAISASKLFFDLLGARTYQFINAPKELVFDFNFLYLFNTSLAALTKIPTFIFLVGINLRLDVPILNLRISKLIQSNNISVYRIGTSSSYFSFKSKYLSSNFASFFEIVEFRHFFCKNLFLAFFRISPLFLFGSNAAFVVGNFTLYETITLFLCRLFKFSQNFTFLPFFTTKFSFFGFLLTYSGRIHAADCGFMASTRTFTGLLPVFGDLYQVRGSNICDAAVILYSIGADLQFINECGWLNWRTTNKLLFLVYQGSHGNGLAASADLIFPVLTYVEQTTFYKNLFGFVQKASLTVLYDFSLKSDKTVFSDFLVFLISIAGFLRYYTLNFRNSVNFNLGLAVFFEEQLSTNFLLPFYNRLSVNSGIAGEFYYILGYTYLTDVRNGLGILPGNTFSVFYQVMGVFFKITLVNSLLNSGLLNYYMDFSLPILGASKTMSTCAALQLKKNVSFSTIYY